MAYTVPQFVLDLEIPATDPATIRLELAHSAALGIPKTVNAIIPAGTYRNDRRYATAENLAHEIASALEAAETAAGTNGTWTADEVSTGTLKGRTQLTRTKIPGDVVTSLETVDGAILPREFIGWTADSVTPVSFLTGEYWDAGHMPQGLWIPQSTTTILMTRDEAWRDDVVVVTETPTGEGSQDYYGGVNRRDVDISWIHGASVWPHYLAQTLYADTIGALITDPNAAFDDLRVYWRDLDAAARVCRFSPDIDAPGTYTEVIPQGDWIATTRNAATTINDAPLLCRLSLTLTEV